MLPASLPVFCGPISNTDSFLELSGFRQFRAAFLSICSALHHLLSGGKWWCICVALNLWSFTRFKCWSGIFSIKGIPCWIINCRNHDAFYVSFNLRHHSWKQRISLGGADMVSGLHGVCYGMMAPQSDSTIAWVAL